jgi:MFS family permease
MGETGQHHRRQSSRRRAVVQFYRNAFFWGLGNGLVSTSLVSYLAGSYGAKGFWIGLIIAAPRLVGVLRIATPALMRLVGDRRRFAVVAYLASAAFLVILPFASAPQVLSSRQLSLAVLVAFWTAYHFCEFLGTIAIWSWIGDLVPRTIRGRFVGNRGAWLNAGQVAGMTTGAGGTIIWQHCLDIMGRVDDPWPAYVACMISGAVMFAVAAVLLLRIPNARSTNQEQFSGWREVWLPFRDRAFLRYLTYGGWFSLANGFTGSAQYVFQMRVLDISYATRLGMDGTSQGVQSTIMPWIGREIDRRGNVPVLVISQLLVAVGLLFFVFATPSIWWLIAGAYLFWVAYAGINVAMPNLVLSLTQQQSYASYAAAWYAWTQLVYAVSTLAGGALFDWLARYWGESSRFLGNPGYFAAIFVLGFVLRLAAAGFAARVPEGHRPAENTGKLAASSQRISRL